MTNASLAESFIEILDEIIQQMEKQPGDTFLNALDYAGELKDELQNILEDDE